MEDLWEIAKNRREFNIITELWGPKEDYIQLVGNSRLLEKFFKDKECIYVSDLEDIFLEYEGDDDDIVKLALVYFIEISLLGKDRRTKVDIGFFKIADDWNTFNNYDWEKGPKPSSPHAKIPPSLSSSNAKFLPSRLLPERRRPLLLSLTSSSSNVTGSCYRFDLNAPSPLRQRCCYPLYGLTAPFDVEMGIAPRRVYFTTKNGTLLELSELEPPRLVDHGQPRDANVAAVADVACFRTKIVYTISAVIRNPKDP
ncbi:Ulp1-like peptidase [Cucumis melo var. makuwa]|uniref:Ulp1-like peptidase n=1 Tax=Cucumis melo var. makuwa TaxID=1194695 RepID=A0A5A7T1L4_CUCMM|nr:Ulp1-like peptidase [Cucumis melo var. makuwa]